MGTQAAHSISCALTQSPPPVSGLTLPAASMPCAYAGMDPAAAGSNAYRIVPRITHVDRVIIHGYFHQCHPALPLGPADKATPPAGLRGRRLPADLERKLSVLPAGYQRVLVGSDVLLIKTATQTVIDVLRHVDATS